MKEKQCFKIPPQIYIRCFFFYEVQFGGRGIKNYLTQNNS